MLGDYKKIIAVKIEKGLTWTITFSNTKKEGKKKKIISTTIELLIQLEPITYTISIVYFNFEFKSVTTEIGNLQRHNALKKIKRENPNLDHTADKILQHLQKHKRKFKFREEKKKPTTPEFRMYQKR